MRLIVRKNSKVLLSSRDLERVYLITIKLSLIGDNCGMQNVKL